MGEQFPPSVPAGTLGRPALPVGQLDPGAWRVLRWRQDHLPLDRLRRPWHRQTLAYLEQRAAWRVASRLGLEDDQRYSLIWHHGDQVGRRMAAAGPGRDEHGRLPRGSAFSGLMASWQAWLRNRRGDLRYQLFRLRTAGAYRGGPPLRR